MEGEAGEVLNPAKSDSGVQAIDHECKPLPLYSILQELAISFQGQGRFLLVCGGTQTMHSLVLCAVLSCVQLFETLWTVAHQALPSMGFSRQEYWGRLPFPPPGDLTDPGSNPPLLYFLHSFICNFNYRNTNDVLESNFHKYHLILLP